MSLVARHLEAHGIPTVVLGSALDIVEHCGVPRFLFTDFPLGNPCGKPFDRDGQREIVGQALDLLQEAAGPRTTVHVAQRWGDDEWRERYMQVREQDRARLLEAGDALRVRRARMRARGTAGRS